MPKYIEQLQKFWEKHSNMPRGIRSYDSRLEFVGSHIFGFTTYDGDVDELFARNMLEVCEAILNKTNFEYHGASEQNYHTYLLMVNMPFLEDKLEWRTSIRGAWFETSAFGGYGPDGKSLQRAPYFIGGITVPVQEIKEFIQDLLDWTKEERAFAEEADEEK